MKYVFNRQKSTIPGGEFDEAFLKDQFFDLWEKNSRSLYSDLKSKIDGFFDIRSIDELEEMIQLRDQRLVRFLSLE